MYVLGNSYQWVCRYGQYTNSELEVGAATGTFGKSRNGPLVTAGSHVQHYLGRIWKPSSLFQCRKFWIFHFISHFHSTRTVPKPLPTHPNSRQVISNAFHVYFLHNYATLTPIPLRILGIQGLYHLGLKWRFLDFSSSFKVRIFF